MVNFEEFKKIELKIGKIKEATALAGSNKLLVLKIDLGEEVRRILAGIAKSYSPESLIGKEVVVVVNLEPRQIMGLESEGMVLAVGTEKGPILITPEKEVLPGSKVS
ncbi:MAG: methionine--tRNA ligase subunit beta [Candidatus Paceibacterota bacterium]|jgi:methionine--tRNA ligase beta chain|nr:methionine--tRNA ligase subunit beta [Candidatus Paceibacterota bacterium]MDD3548786.1 methionine--tRNA ligase subunit beta [Candidatus Paceibacterota bacterium]MDD4999265.1 methionine--tRNA ligase subunit beta [Candidatus Paceibacterota bacterium]